MTLRPTEGKFTGRGVMVKPTCPFCGMLIQRPEAAPSREMPIGICSCSAVYACDVTGHNLGAAMIQALVHACGGDWDYAWDLTSDQDYVDQQLKTYDLETHYIIPGGVYEGRRISGVLYFIRLNEAAPPKAAPEQPEGPISPHGPAPASQPPRRPSSKQEVEALVRAYDLNALLEMAAQDHRILRDLKRLLYSADKLLRWRAAEALGKASAVIISQHPTAVSKLIQGLFSSVSDTAASSWGSVDAIGEIIGSLPDRFSGFIPQLVQLSKDPLRFPEVLRAMAKIAETRSDLLRRFSHPMASLLHDADPEVRGYVAILLGHLRALEAKDDLVRLQEDMNEIVIYRAGELRPMTLAQIAVESLARL